MRARDDPHAGAHGGGGEDGIIAQHARGKLTAAERIELLLDPDSFEPIGNDANDGVLCGCGQVNGRLVFVHARASMTSGGALSEMDAQKIATLQEMALARHAPIIGLFDSRGVDIADGQAMLAAYGAILRQSACAAGEIPQIALIMGPCIGFDAFAVGACDFIFMVREEGTLFVTGPEVVTAATHESIGAEELGGALVSVASGVADAVYDNDVQALLQLRRVLDFLPSSRGGTVPAWPSFDDPARCENALDSLVPDDPGRVYDVKELILKIVDEGDFFEIKAAHAQNIVTGFGRIDGRPVGIIANQPLVLAGVIDGAAARKAARFIHFCGRFNIPLVTFVDVPGFLPGAAEEQGGLVRDGAELIFAYAGACVKKVTIILRHAFGAAHAMMGSKALGADVVYAWPSAQVGLLGAQAAAEILVHDDQERSEIAARVQAYRDSALSSHAAAARGLIDAIIAPHETRPRMAHALAEPSSRPASCSKKF